MVLNGADLTTVAAKGIAVGAFKRFCDMKRRRSICCKDLNEIKFEKSNGILIDDFLDEEEVELSNAPELTDLINRERNINAVWDLSNLHNKNK